MGHKQVSLFFRISGIVSVIAFIVVFFVNKDSAEFYITLASLVLSLIVFVICAVLLNRKEQ